MAIANAVQMRMVWTSSSKLTPDNNVLGIVVNDPGQPVDAAYAAGIGAAARAAFISSGWQTRCQLSYTLAQVFVRDLRVDFQPEVDSLIAPVSGTSATDEYAFNSAAVVTLRTGLAGRSFRGRTFLGGFTETFVDAGVLTAVAYDDAVAFIQDLYTGLLAFDVSIDGLGVISQLRQEINLVPDLPQIVGRSATVGTQRRRQRRI